jgi:COP9 signalosome complex subunit 3
LIQIDAYKKLVLVQLLAYGKVRRPPPSLRAPAHDIPRVQTQPLPRYTSQVFLTAAKTLCAPYLEYCAAFASLNRERVDQAREKGREAFEKVRQPPCQL